jgi:hypothetical protein
VEKEFNSNASITTGSILSRDLFFNHGIGTAGRYLASCKSYAIDWISADLDRFQDVSGRIVERHPIQVFLTPLYLPLSSRKLLHQKRTCGLRPRHSFGDEEDGVARRLLESAKKRDHFDHGMGEIVLFVRYHDQISMPYFSTL